uniref:Tryptophan synthase beta chain-like PALP domain-containing protein n=2 Tax=Phytophthora ramorum TaxID=164328 RepID=H3H271_PHYRM
MYWFVRQRDEFFSDAHLLSFGGSQSNAMLALAQLADARQVPFTYFSRELCLREEQEEGNLALAMSLGMKHVQLHPDAYHELVRTRDFAAFLDGELRLPPGTRSLYVPQGAAFPEAQDGVKLLAEEINEYVETQDKRFSVVLPCGTGTTALYLAQHLHPEIKLYAVPCVGDAAYLQLQFRQLIDEDPTLQLQTALLPQVLTPERKSHFGRLWWPLHDMYHEVLQETEVDFDLVYGAFAWHTLFADDEVLDEVLDRGRLGVASRLGGEVREEDSTGSERELMYIHTGGTSGNATMLASLSEHASTMSFRELRNLTEMMRALGYPRPISMENFRTPNFELVSDLLYWMVKKYDPSSSVTEEIDTEDDRVEFLTQVATEVLAKARIRLNPKRLYAADGFAVKELIKLARVLYEASRIDLATQQEPDDDDDEVSVKSLLGSRVKDPKATRQLASDITQSGAKLYDLLETELDVRDARQQAIRFLDALSTNNENSSEQKFLERSIQEILVNLQENVELTERQVVELDAEEKALAAKIKKAQTDLERSEKRLKSLQHVRPAFMDEYEKLEKELERQYAIYCERFRNLDYLQRELDLHNSREMKKLAENDRSLKKLQKKFRDDELAILRGEQEDQIENSMLDAMEANNNNRHSGKARQASIPGSNQKGRAAVSKKKAGSDEDSSDISGSGSGSSDDDDSSDESAPDGVAPSAGGKGAAADGSDSDQVSLADSGELIDNDDDSGSDAGSGSGSGSGSGASGSETNSDSDQDF